MRWAGDAEGGAPYVEADPADPTTVVGFDVEIAELIAKGLGRKPQFVEIAFASIDQSIARGDAEIGLSGIEDTPAHRAAFAVECVDLAITSAGEQCSIGKYQRSTKRSRQSTHPLRHATLTT